LILALVVSSLLRLLTLCRDFADAHPQATIIGTDVSPIQPNFVPPNLKFEIDDAQMEWTWPNNHFDFVHLRCMMGSIDNWPLLYERAFRCTKPGGWIEHMDFDIQFTSDDGSVKPGDVLNEWPKHFFDSGEAITGRTFYIPRRAKGLMEAAGFVDLVEKKYKLPIGSWMDDPRMKEIGNFNRLFMLTGLDGFSLYVLSNILGVSCLLAFCGQAMLTIAVVIRGGSSYHSSNASSFD
jgi:hypothetical protein